MAAKTSGELVRPAELAEMLGLPWPEVYRRIEALELPAVVVDGKVYVERPAAPNLTRVMVGAEGLEPPTPSL